MMIEEAHHPTKMQAVHHTASTTALPGIVFSILHDAVPRRIFRLYETPPATCGIFLRLPTGQCKEKGNALPILFLPPRFFS